MRKTNVRRFIVTLTLACSMITFVSAQATFTSALETGNWNEASSWTLSSGSDADGIPDANDNVIIATGNKIILTADAECNDITFQGASAGNKLAIGNFMLTVSGTLNADVTNISGALITTGTGRLKFIGTTRALFGSNWGANPSGWRFEVALNTNETGSASTNVKGGEIIISSGTFSAQGTYLCPDNGSANTGNLIIESGAVLNCKNLSRSTASGTAFGTLTMNGSGKIIFANAGTTQIPIGQNCTYSSDAMIEFQGSANTIPDIDYPNLIINGNQNGTIKTWSISSARSASKITITKGTLLFSTSAEKDFTVSGNVELNNTATGAAILTTGGNNLIIRGDVTGSASMNIDGGSLMFLGSGNQSFSSTVLAGNNTGKIYIGAGSHLTNNGTLNGQFFINSDNSGTGTFIDNGTSVFTSSNIQQYLPSARNWYISSPVTAAKAKTGYTFYSRDETLTTGTEGWVTMTTGDGTTTGDALTPGKGYIANLASGTATYSFTGTLNNGNVDVALTRTGATAQSGYNLVGNPYPSYINWDNATLTNVKTTIWQRSNSGSAYVFDTYNSSGNVAVDLSGNRTNGNIAPMQAFWVQVADGQTGGTVRFTNSMRAHKGSKAITGGTVNDPIFKVGASASATAQPAMMRLQVSNGINTDETVFYQNENAQNSVDRYDSPKMSNSNAAIPEIYSLVNGNKLTINGVNSIDANTEFPLGFVTGQANSFSLKVSQLSNMNPELQVVLKDKVTGAQQVMTEGSVYNFTSDATSASDRFSVLFRSTSATTGVNDIAVKNKFGVYVNDAGSIVVDLFDASATGTAAVYNIAGSRVAGQLLKASKSVLETKAASGIYMVKVSNGTLTETHRVIIK